AQLVPNAVSPLRLAGLPSTQADARPLSIQLPATAHTFDVGHRLRVVVATADQAFRGPTAPAQYGLALPKQDPAISLPAVPATASAAQDAGWRSELILAVAAIAVLVGIAAAIIIARRRRGRRDRIVEAGLADIPLVVRDLRKTYRDGLGRGGYVAVRGVSFTVQADRVVGLLGPNGAGKTTTLRMVLGLISATSGTGFIFGHRAGPGAPVLCDVGALVEGPGLLPHVSGRENLELYWRATGRPLSDAQLDRVLEIAALGEAIERKTRTYSHGMKQRLAIAQAMLGMPRLLLLDEPTDGLDPPQIATMRGVLQRYATDGRAVLISSHLLAEVEQTCSHVVVMHRGRDIAAGPVTDVIGASASALLEVSEPQRATQLLHAMSGVVSVETDAGSRSEASGDTGGLVVTLSRPRSEIVTELVSAGIAVERVAPRRRLEDAFLALVADGADDLSDTAGVGATDPSTAGESATRQTAGQHRHGRST
ncbi:MAG: ATP-binding cassette domain-containing protein, partial [Mycobacteriales bacterium]